MTTKHCMKRDRVRHILSSIAQPLLIVVVTLAVLEVALRIADLSELRDTVSEHSTGYDYDAELGWAPVPNLASQMTTFRTTHFRHNSLGLRDAEFTPGGKPTIMFLGDSFVWGLDSEAGERFSELLKPRLPGYKILAAGVAGYGTDQEYLLLKRLWPKVKPAVVVLVFCAENDRLDNVTNVRYANYHKPYFATEPDGSLALMGQPVPKSHLLYYRDDWLVRNLWLARLATDVYLRLRDPPVFVPDPTEKLVGKIREFVEGNGARFFVAIQQHDAALASYLEAKAIPFAKLEGAPHYTAGWGPHWTPEGHQIVADRIFQMLAANHIASESPDAR